MEGKGKMSLIRPKLSNTKGSSVEEEEGEKEKKKKKKISVFLVCG
jgi:hypothetical protein